LFNCYNQPCLHGVHISQGSKWVIPEKIHTPPDGWQAFLTLPPPLIGFPRRQKPPSRPDFQAQGPPALARISIFFKGPNWKQQALEKT